MTEPAEGVCTPVVAPTREPVPPDAPADVDRQLDWDGKELADVSFVVFALSRKVELFERYRDMLIYMVFLIVFTVTVILGHYHDDGYHVAAGVGLVPGQGEWDQAGSTGLYFEKTQADIGNLDDWYAWAQSSNTMQSVVGQPSETFQQQNKVLPGVVRLMQRRVKKSDVVEHCEGANDLLKGDWSGMVGCYPKFSAGVEDQSPIPNTNVTDPECPCGCDPLDNGAFRWAEVTLGSLDCQVPALARQQMDWVGRFGHYPEDGYLIYVNASDSTASWVSLIQCLQAQSWLDPGTRQVEITFFTYNPHLNLFLHTRLSTEFTASGLVYSSTRLTPFRWSNFDTPTPENKAQVGLDITTFLFVAFFVAQFLWEVGMDIVRRRRFCLVFFSVWRMVDTVNLSLFVTVYVWKFTYWQIGDIYFRPPASCNLLGCAATVCTDTRFDGDRDTNGNPTGTVWPFFYATQVHALLTGYVVHYNFINQLTCINALLSWLRVFRFASLSPRLGLLSETIKESAAALAGLTIYVFVITMAFALMGLVLFSPYSERLSTLEKAVFYLLRWLLGDFDYDELLEATMHVHTFQLFFFFWGYQMLVWVVLLNMVISIVSVGFDTAKNRADRASGSAPLGPQMRNVVDRLEMFVRTGHWERKYPKGPVTVHWDGVRFCGARLDDIVKCIQALEWLCYAEDPEVQHDENCCCGYRSRVGKKDLAQDDLEKILHPAGVSRDQLTQSLQSAQVRMGGWCGFFGRPVSETEARGLAGALCWYFAITGDGRHNRYKQAIFEARVYWDLQVLELRRQMQDAYKLEFLMESDDKRSPQAQQMYRSSVDYQPGGL